MFNPGEKVCGTMSVSGHGVNGEDVFQTIDFNGTTEEFAEMLRTMTDRLNPTAWVHLTILVNPG